MQISRERINCYNKLSERSVGKSNYFHGCTWFQTFVWGGGVQAEFAIPQGACGAVLIVLAYLQKIII